MRSLFALPTVVLCCGLAFAAKAPTTKISVHVTNMSGGDVEQAEVAVRVVKGAKAVTKWRLRTHEDGFAHTPAEMQVPQGTILVEVTADEYEPFSQQFEVHEDERTIEVKLGSAMTNLVVHVTTMGGRALDHAEVVVKFVKGRSIIELGRKLHTTWEVRTNQEGIAKVPPIPRGTILIQVNAKGYQTYGQTFDVDDLRRTIEVKLNSPQEQYSAH